MAKDPALLHLIRTQLTATRAALAAAHASLAAFEELISIELSEDVEEPSPVRTPAPAARTDASGEPIPLGAVLPEECPHPSNRRTEARAMGHPNRFICQECGETVEG